MTDIVEKLELSTGAGRTQFTPIPPQHAETYAKISAFKKRAHQLVQTERAAASKSTVDAPNGLLNGSDHVSNSSSASSSVARIHANSNIGKTVLTLLGNGGRQMFSSLQKAIKVDGEDIYPAVREAGLPNGITTTRVVSAKSPIVPEEKKRYQTIGELFPTPSSVPQMQPPKPSKNATTRSSVVKWYQPDAVDGDSRYGCYARQHIYVGQWLDYSGSSPSGAKRKQRERTLSLTGKVPPKGLDPVESEAEKLNSLFRTAYSGFAPTKDDTHAIVPENQLSRIWWQRTGERAFEKMLRISSEEQSVDGQVNKIDGEMKQLEKVVENWEPEAIDPDLPSTTTLFEKSAEEKEVDEVLEGISELLETLNSYQRIRHMTLNNSNRPSGQLSAPDTTSLGTPSKPSEPELATYEILKSQLTILISTLPPYALAKLDSTQLGELGISTKIEVQVEDHKGVMEEDDASARARNAAFNAASNTQPRAASTTTQHRPSTNSLYGNQYAASRNSSVTAQYFGASQTPVRAAQPTMSRSPASAPNPYQPPRNPSTSYRPNGYGAPNYQQPPPRPVQQFVNTPNTSQPYSHTPSTPNFGRAGSQGYQPTTQTQNFLNRYSQQPYTQPKPIQNGYQYGSSQYYQSQHSPSSSSMFSPSMPPAQHRQSYSHSPTPPLQDRRNSYVSGPMTGNTMMNGGRPSPSPQMPQSNTTTFSTWMTPKQQAEMLDRQRAQAQIAQQQQARSAAQAGAVASPSAHLNGNPVTAGS